MDNAAIASVGQGSVEATIRLFPERPISRPFATQETSQVFEEWFTRCRGSLYFTARRVLGGIEGAELAVQNCWLTASRNPPTLDREGAFRSWLLRVLIDEASVILLESRIEERYDHANPSP